MKKIIFILAVTIASVSAFANDNLVNNKVLDAFNREFAGVQDVQWTASKDFYRVSFVYNAQHISVFYSNDGERIGVARYISSTDLPVVLQSSLTQKYKGYWISDVFEMSNAEGTGYYITLENADAKLVLKSMNGDEWSKFQRTAK